MRPLDKRGVTSPRRSRSLLIPSESTKICACCLSRIYHSNQPAGPPAGIELHADRCSPALQGAGSVDKAGTAYPGRARNPRWESGMGIQDPPSPANRGWGWGWTKNRGPTGEQHIIMIQLELEPAGPRDPRELDSEPAGNFKLSLGHGATPLKGAARQGPAWFSGSLSRTGTASAGERAGTQAASARAPSQAAAEQQRPGRVTRRARGGRVTRQLPPGSRAGPGT